MKIAIQLFGHLRTYKECYLALKEYLLNNYDCDVFLHTWDTIDHSTKTWHNRFMPNAKDNTQDIVNELKSIYNLKDIKIEHQDIKDLGVINAINKDISIFGMQCMFHSMKEVNSLREKYQQENNVQYDFVITLRPDLKLTEQFNIEYYLQRMSNEDIDKSFFTYFFPMVGLWNDYKKIGASDIFFFAKPDVISNIFANINFVVDKIKPITIDFGPEVYFLELVKHLGYDINLIRYANNTEHLIKRPAVKKKNFSLRIRLKNSHLLMFPNLGYNILDFKFSIGKLFKIRICIGEDNE